MNIEEIKRLAMANPDIEYWLPVNVDDAREYYSISSHGRVISYRPRNGVYTGINTNSGLMRKVQRFKTGYLYIGLRYDNGEKKILLHRAIAITFIDNPHNHPQVNHIDGNKENNRIDNLEWVTPSQNVQHSFDNGLNIGSHHVYVKNNGKSPTAADSIDQVKKVIELLKNPELTQKEISAATGVKLKSVSSIKLGVTWKHLPR